MTKLSDIQPVILMRNGLEEESELEIANKYFPVHNYRTQIDYDSLVIGRYSVLPYYLELETELLMKRSRLINSFEQHNFIADQIEYWANDILEGLTPRVYREWHNVPQGSYVLKGSTNSRKFQWDTHMFARTREDIPTIARNLYNDSLISPQGVIARPYVPLKRIEEGINQLPMGNEWRVFCYKDKILSYGFYWTAAEQAATINKEPLPEPAMSLIKEACSRLQNHVNFYVMDIAETETGEWIIIELNDGQMSGLSMNFPDTLYSNLMSFILSDMDRSDEKDA